MILRVQSPDGTKRIEVSASDNCFTLLKKIAQTFDLKSLDSFRAYTGRDKREKIVGVERKLVSDLSLRQGDILFVEFESENGSAGSEETNSITSDSSFTTRNNRQSVELARSLFTSLTEPSKSEDAVDICLWGMSGQIERPRDEKLCRHGPNAKCLHCTPLEPYDEAYLKEHGIKHMSFHSYLKKMTRGVDKGKFAFLEDISCRIKSGCREHPPWPQGICSSCQPNAVTLNPQVYRHVDNVVFENASIVDRFLDYWRKTGHQRIGFLFGKYEIHTDVPLGIKANVVAIYEPLQLSTCDSVRLLPDPKHQVAESIASRLGLQKLGWIFTDLVPLDHQKGTVKCVRGADSHFLSAQECIMAGHIQNAYPNPCRLSPTGFFGSKSVTVCVTGNSENQIHMEGYQVSNQCMALVRDDCLVPTKDAPELGYVRETTKDQFVPDVFFKEKDNFGNEVTKIARPLPIEYLLVDVPASTPNEPKRTFNPLSQYKSFAIENRPLDQDIQDLVQLHSYLNQFPEGCEMEALTDFHLLVFLSSCDALNLSSQDLEPLLRAIRKPDRTLVSQWVDRCDAWLNAKQLIALNGAHSQPVPDRNSVSDAVWNCTYCTFENKSSVSSCEMCGLPKS